MKRGSGKAGGIESWGRGREIGKREIERAGGIESRERGEALEGERN